MHEAAKRTEIDEKTQAGLKFQLQNWILTVNIFNFRHLKREYLTDILHHLFFFSETSQLGKNWSDQSNRGGMAEFHLAASVAGSWQLCRRSFLGHSNRTKLSLNVVSNTWVFFPQLGRCKIAERIPLITRISILFTIDLRSFSRTYPSPSAHHESNASSPSSYPSRSQKKREEKTGPAIKKY